MRLLAAAALALVLSAPARAQMADADVDASTASVGVSTSSVYYQLLQKTKRKPLELPGELLQLKTTDGWTLTARYFEAEKPEDALTGEGQPTFVLLHEARGRRTNWYWLARRFAREGIGCLALDLRGHGLSKHPPEDQPASWKKFRTTREDNPWKDMSQDVDAAVAYLRDMALVQGSIGLIGADVGGSLAIRYAALHPEISMVVMLSPGINQHKVPTVSAIRAYTGRPILMIVGEDQRRDMVEGPILHGFAKMAAGEAYATIYYTPRGHGTRMLYFDRSLLDKIVDWIRNPIQPVGFEAGTSTDTSRTGFFDLSDDGELPTEEDLDQFDRPAPDGRTDREQRTGAPEDIETSW